MNTPLFESFIESLSAGNIKRFKMTCNARNGKHGSALPEVIITISVIQKRSKKPIRHMFEEKLYNERQANYTTYPTRCHPWNQQVQEVANFPIIMTRITFIYQSYAINQI